MPTVPLTCARLTLHFPAAAFLEFHEPLAAWMNAATSLFDNDTLLASGEVYNNITKLDVLYRK